MPIQHPAPRYAGRGDWKPSWRAEPEPPEEEPERSGWTPSPPASPPPGTRILKRLPNKENQNASTRALSMGKESPVSSTSSKFKPVKAVKPTKPSPVNGTASKPSPPVSAAPSAAASAAGKAKVTTSKAERNDENASPGSVVSYGEDGWPTRTPSERSDPPPSATGWRSERSESRGSGSFTAVPASKSVPARTLRKDAAPFVNRFAALESRASSSGADSRAPSVSSHAPSVMAEAQVRTDTPEWRKKLSVRKEAVKKEPEMEEEVKDEYANIDPDDEGEWEDTVEHSGWTPPGQNAPLPDVDSRHHQNHDDGWREEYEPVAISEANSTPMGPLKWGKHKATGKFKVPPSPTVSTGKLSATSGASRRRKKQARAAAFATGQGWGNHSAHSAYGTKSASVPHHKQHPQSSVQPQQDREASSTPPLFPGMSRDRLITPRQASQLLDTIMHWLLASLEADGNSDPLGSDDEGASFPYGPARPPEAKTRQERRDSHLWRALWRDIKPVRIKDKQYRKKGGGESLFLLLCRESRLYRDECRYLRQVVEGKRGETEPGIGEDMSVEEAGQWKKYQDGVRVGTVRGYDEGVSDGYHRGYDRGLADGRRERNVPVSPSAPKTSLDPKAAPFQPGQPLGTVPSNINNDVDPSSARQGHDDYDDYEEDNESPSEAIDRLKRELAEKDRRIGVLCDSVDTLHAQSFERNAEVYRLREQLHRNTSVKRYEAEREADAKADDDEIAYAARPESGESSDGEDGSDGGDDDLSARKSEAPRAKGAVEVEAGEDVDEDEGDENQQDEDQEDVKNVPRDIVIERLTNERDDLASRLDAATTELEQVYDDLYTELDRVAALEEKLSSMTSDRDRLVGDKLSLETTNVSLRSTNTTLETELDNLLVRVEAFERAERTAAEDLRSAAARLDSELRKSSALAEELDEMAKALDTLRNERDRAVEERDAVAPTVEKLTERIEAMQEYCTEQDVRLAQLQQSAALMQDDEDVDALHDEINALNAHVEELEAQVVDLNGQLEQMGKEWGRSLAELASTKRELEKAERASTRNGMTPPPTRPGSNGYEAHSRSASFRRPPSVLSSRTASATHAHPAQDDIVQAIRDELRGAHVSSRTQLRSELRSTLDISLASSLDSTLDSSLRTALDTTLGPTIDTALSNLMSSIRYEIRDEIRGATREATREATRAALSEDKANWTMKTEWAARKKGYNDAVHEMNDPSTAAGNMHRRLLREELRNGK